MRARLATAAVAALAAGAGGFALAGPGAEDCVAQAGGSADVEPRIDCGTSAGAGGGATRPGAGGTGAGACASAALFGSVSARARGSRLALGFTRRPGVGGSPRVELFRTARGRRVTGERRVARRTRSGTVGGRLPSGYYFARFRISSAGRGDVRRIALRRRGGRFAVRPAYFRRESCGTLRTFKLSGPAFGGTTRRSLGIAYRLDRAARVTVTVTRGRRTVRRYAARSVPAGRTVRVRLAARGTRRGDHRVSLRATPVGGGGAVAARLTSARL